MTHVVAEPCIMCKHTDCVTVCPVDCFHEGENFLVIDPEECIDCAACVPECPEEAIFADDELPEEWAEYVEINERLTPNWPVLTEQRDSMEEAADWSDRKDKREALSENPGEGD